MNRYGAMAEHQWKTWLPDRYATIPDPGSFLSALGIAVSERIAALELELLGPDRMGEDFPDPGGSPEHDPAAGGGEIVLSEQVLLPPEQDSDDELPPPWSAPTAAQTVAAVAALKTVAV